jgi:hypothetical protein
MLSTIDLVELEVLRITSAPRRGEALSVAHDFIRAKIADQFVFVGGVRNCDGLEICCLCVLHCQVPEPTDPEHGHAFMRLGSAQRRLL